MTARHLQISACCGLLLATLPVRAQSGGAPAPAPAPGSEQTASCVERVPEGKRRPELQVTFPERGSAGHVAWLEVTVEHGAGESLLPSGVKLDSTSSAAKTIERAGFLMPHADAGVRASIESQTIDGLVRSVLRVPFVPVPPEPGRQELTLPPVPITLARASGDLVTVCTDAEPIIVEDPTANEPEPLPRGNPEPQRQLEVWTFAKHATFIGLIAVVVGALLAWAIAMWRKRPRTGPPAPPPKPPWHAALQELFDIRHSGLLEQERHAEHFERVANTIRRYVGERFGFDGLECTTRETLELLGRAELRSSIHTEIEIFLAEADLVKFAQLTPTKEQCEQALERGERIVRQTIPAPDLPADSGDEATPAGAASSSDSHSEAKAAPTAAHDASTPSGAPSGSSEASTSPGEARQKELPEEGDKS